MRTKHQDTADLAKRIRKHALRMTSAAKSSHIGSCLSMADLLAVIYGEYIDIRPDDMDWDMRDRVLVSKGHAAAAYYAVLAEVGCLPLEMLDHFGKNNQPLSGHVTHFQINGVEFSSGSLGHGLSLAAGISLGLKQQKSRARCIVILSDGECDEGSIWEAALFAPHHCLNNLICVVDYNKIQSFGSVSNVLELEPFADKWRSFRWQVEEIDGHDHAQIRQALRKSGSTDEPLVIIAHTIKGKGVSFMENKLLWHYRSASEAELKQALTEVETAQE